MLFGGRGLMFLMLAMFIVFGEGVKFGV